MGVDVLTWNLMHGRSIPPAGRELFDEFTDALATWPWDFALLQEAPPWWPALLRRRLGCGYGLVLTSRNSLLPVRRAIARRWPDVIKSNGGGANAILVRGHRVIEHRGRLLRRFPERRWLHAVRTASGPWIGNLHAGGTLREARLAAETILHWAGAEPIVLGGDFNLRELPLHGFTSAAVSRPDHILVRGLDILAPGRALPHGRLSDHTPVLARLGYAS